MRVKTTTLSESGEPCDGVDAVRPQHSFAGGCLADEWLAQAGAWRWFAPLFGLGVLALGLVSTFRIGDGELRRLLLNVSFVAASAILVGSSASKAFGRRSRWDPRALWLLGAGLGWLFGNSWWFYYQEISGSQPSPSMSDVGYISALICVGGLVSTYLPSARDGSALLRLLVDGLLVCMAILVFAWLLYVHHATQQADGLSPLALTVSLAYPIVEIGLLTLISLAMRDGLADDISLRVLATGLALYVMADFGWNLTSVYGGYTPGTTPFDAAWTGAYGLLAVVPWLPSSGRRSTPALSRSTFSWSFRPVVVACAATAALIFLGRDGIDSADLLMLAALVSLTLLRQILLTQDFLALTRSLEDEVADRTSALVRSHEEMRHLALHDSLTGLANRRHFMNALDLQAHQSSGVDTLDALVLLDLDDFKDVNDSLGHARGDDLLIEIAARLLRVSRESDLVARVGGDEFAVLLRGVDDASLRDIAERMIQCIREPLTLGTSRPVVPQTSAGLTWVQPGTDAIEMMVKADVAMYAAKRAGKNSFSMYDPAVHSEVAELHEVETSVRFAATNGELVLHYQPVLRNGTGEVIGCEALVRWQHPERGLLPPGEFIPIAERLGAIHDIGAWVLEEACRQAAVWRAGDRTRQFAMAVNVSPLQLRHRSFVDNVTRTLTHTGLDPNQLIIELTETCLHDVDHVERVLHQLREGGVRVALDDFGTGYSSLGSLRRLPIDLLKIDRSFIDQLDHPQGLAFLRTIVELAHTLGMRTCAEGVERREQFEIVSLIGTDESQGWLFGRAVPAAEFARLYLQQPSPDPSLPAAGHEAELQAKS